MPRQPNKRQKHAKITPEDLLTIGSQWLEGVPITKIAKRLSVDESTIRHHIAASIRPAWERDMQRDRMTLLAKVAHIERIAWERFHSDQPAETVEQVKEGLSADGADKTAVEQVLKERNVKKIFRPGQTAWLSIVQWCLDFRAKIDGLYEPERHEVKVEELRVAGPDRAAKDREMLAKWLQAAKDRVARRSLPDYPDGSRN